MLLLLWGCGQVSMPYFEPDGMSPDGSGDSGDSDATHTGNDADSIDSNTMSSCPVPGEFAVSWGVPVKIPLSAAERKWAPSVSCDDKELYFHGLSGTYDIFMARRSTAAAPWSTAVAIGFGAGDEREPEIAPDGVELYYTRNQTIYRATRSDPDTPWVEADELFGGASPSVSGDGLSLYYIHDYRLERRRRDNLNDTWGAPEVIPTPSGTRYQRVAISAEGSTILLLQPVELAAPRVKAKRAPNDWVDVPELDAMTSCDFTWQGDLLCSDSSDLYYIPNRQL
jgi:hypothetical protein